MREIHCDAKGKIQHQVLGSRLIGQKLEGGRRRSCLLVDLGDGTIEEDDGGVIEALKSVLPRELEVILEPR